MRIPQLISHISVIFKGRKQIQTFEFMTSPTSNLPLGYLSLYSLIEMKNFRIFDQNQKAIKLIAIQLGHPQIVHTSQREFQKLQDAFLHLFSPQEESIYLFWHRIPIRFRYREDMHANFNQILSILRLLQKEPTGVSKVNLMTQGLFINWEIAWNAGELRIVSRFTDTEDTYQKYAEALNQHPILRVSKLAFLREWKALLHQLIMGFQTAQIKLSDASEQRKWESMRQIEARIMQYGVLYTKKQ